MTSVVPASVRLAAAAAAASDYYSLVLVSLFISTAIASRLFLGRK